MQQPPVYAQPASPKKGPSALAIVAIVLGLLAACGIGSCVVCITLVPSPSDVTKESKAKRAARPPRSVTPGDYVGTWTGPGATMVVTSSNVEFKKESGGTKTSVNGPYTLVNGDMEVNILVTTYTLDVDETPHEVGGVWKMKVEGVELERAP